MMFDCHRHITFGKANIAELIDQMDQDKIDKSIVFGYQGITIFEEVHRQDFKVARVAQEYPSRLVPFFCDIDFYSTDAVEYSKTMIREGFKGMGEILIGHTPIRQAAFPNARLNDPEVIRIFRLMGEYGLPVLFHADPPFFNDALEMLKACPSTAFIWAHAGFDFLSTYGGSENKPSELNRWLDAHDNLNFDISHWKISPVYLCEPEWVAILENRYDRFLFGTDMTENYLVQSVWMPAYRIILEKLSGRAKAAISNGNLNRMIQV